MTIKVTDLSTTVIPEIAWGFDLNTGRWIASMNFSEEGFNIYD